MKQLPLSPTDLLALLCLVGLTVGVALVASLGWALIVLSALVLIYLLLPDQRANP
jgi:hypothetical protein